MIELLLVGCSSSSSSSTFVPPPRATTDTSPCCLYSSARNHIKLSRSRPPPKSNHRHHHQNNVVPALIQKNQSKNLSYYGELASKLAGDGKMEDFVMIAETVLASSNPNPADFVATLNTHLVSLGVSTLISQGRLPYLLQIFTRIHNLGIIPATLFQHKSLFQFECRRLLKARRLNDLVHLLETLAGFFFSVKELVKPSEIFKLCLDQTDPDMAVRYADMLPHAPAMYSSIILEFGKRGDLTSAVSAYAASKCKSDVPNMYVCRTVIDVCGLCGDPLKSRNIYEDLLAENVIPNT